MEAQTQQEFPFLLNITGLQSQIPKNMIFFDYFPCCQPKASGFLVAFLMAILSISLIIVSGLDLNRGSSSAVFHQKSLVIAALVFGIMGLLSCVDLVVGLMVQKRWLLVPFLVTFGIMWVTTLAFAFKFLIQVGMPTSEEVSKSSRFYTPWTIIVTGILLYQWAVVVDLFNRLHPQVLKEEEELRRTTAQPPS
ncbi:hypothetical protein TCAL_10257 [Tigriopus californicus]|uniref:MARVEL domain-containing protein n=1 Tax=Tigriopus californicus TaxID=6832 RepID=A0A553NG03_TIGCA|nr:uncharacterized protein LOC131888356 [Tigriopus californicus]TRY64299.1 hypothetical protein TCAL_10257 [Tigriopus californicus]